MSKKILKTIELNGSKSGEISICNLSSPYGVGSNDVLSIGIALKKENGMDWKIHIPYENLKELITALQEIEKMKFNSKN
ncbi:hypothetical protein CINS5915_06575 [Campylobacter insulaenigrae]|uniref:Uncharacterized protein n=2 Tax=Campylobacter insulaenigrae TaxID=260714 RepID=A0A0A8H142_9BACT|nr:hypothetical protein [Campylobacter insulaenigrae]AJC87756.1 hypothetical protein CINS_0790 [Campylobacter insulaenigrae NCTC 12927]MCR6571301.1 hypothetical protein [Campylobacter insulaenigrae]MCR6571835.1 hypothetical protein [Campylobacter insulaenigrae]MCR6574622.1 hypothetical protein [Campylobacter insulaenigrae]MCR6576024.1 hypothetical protein [Campylobacter insulaenigrae]